jgi:WD40 repeat protein
MVWDLASGSCLAVLDGHGAWLNDVAVARDSRTIVTVSGDSMGLVWDVATGKCVKALEGHGGRMLPPPLASPAAAQAAGAAAAPASGASC